MSQLHKRFTSDQVKGLLERYLKDEMERKCIQEILGIKKRLFFTLVNRYKGDPECFSIQYQRATPPRISPEIEQNILNELSVEKEIIRWSHMDNNFVPHPDGPTALHLAISG